MYPGSASSQGFSARVTVSPTLVSPTFLRLAVTYPTIPAESSSDGINCPAPKIPTSTTSAFAPVASIFISSPFFTQPSNIRQNIITPLYASYNESNIRAFNGLSMSPDGAGIFLTICSNTWSIFVPIFAEISGASSASRPITSSISLLTLSGSALGRSILFMTGIISRSWSSAR